MASKLYEMVRDKYKCWRIHFTNPSTGERIEKSFNYDNKEDAIDYANELDYNFYSEHKEYLPPGVTIEKANKRFRLYVRMERELGKDYPKILHSSKMLIDIIKARESILRGLIGIRNYK